MDPYKILSIDKNATKSEIRKAYLKAVFNNHPDRSKDPNANDIIKEIYMAYELLSDETKKQQYDSLTNNNMRCEFYTNFKIYFNNKYPNLTKIIKNLIEVFYGNEDDFKNDFNNCDFVKIYERISTKLPDMIQNYEISTDTIFNNFATNVNIIGDIKDKNELNICGTVHCTLKNKYLNKYEKIQVNRLTKESIYLYVPLRKNTIIFEGFGESYKYQDGDIIIEVVAKEDPDFAVLNNDLICEHNITLYEYIYGGEFKIKHLDDTMLDIKFDSMLYNIPFIRIKEKGLLYEDEKDKSVLKRGDLIIKLKIINLENEDIQNKIKNI